MVTEDDTKDDLVEGEMGGAEFVEVVVCLYGFHVHTTPVCYWTPLESVFFSASFFPFIFLSSV